jgi:6-phosphogluconolactonase
MPWDKTYVFVSDERMTPLESADSNFGNARRALLANVPIPGDHLFVAKTEEATGREAAMAYERSIADFFGVPAGGACPRFDLILLGMGDDGHTASLFPGMSTLSEKTAWVVASPPGILPPPLERITFTYPLINAAQEVVVLVSGRGKANVLHALFDETPSAEEMPAAGIAPVSGNLIWLIDEPASQLLTGRE